MHCMTMSISSADNSSTATEVVRVIRISIVGMYSCRTSCAGALCQNLSKSS